MGNKKTSTQTTNQTQTNAPPSWTLPGLQQTSNRVIQALGQIPTTAYGGDFVAQADPTATQGILDAYRNSGNLSGELSSWLQGQVQNSQQGPTFEMSGLPQFSAYDVGAAPDLTAAINAATHPVFQQLTEQILPGIRSSALDSGAYSGDRAMSVVPGQAIAASNESAQRLAAELGFEDYTNRENRRLAAHQGDQDRLLAAYNADTERGLGSADVMTSRMGQLPDLLNTVMGLSSSQGDLLRIAADYDAATRQAGIDNELARERYNVERPFMGLDIASQLLAQLSGNYGTQTMNGTTKTVEKTGGLGPIVQGALGLGSLVAGFPGVGAALGMGSAAAKAIPMASSVFRPSAFSQVGP